MSGSDLPRTPAVLMKGIVKRFPGVTANRGVDFRILKGEIHSLLGENGAGKTTLMNVLSGFYQPDEGEMFVNGQKVSFRSPRDALDHGIGMIHQHFQLVRNFTVAENIILGVPGPWTLNMDNVEKSVDEISNRYGLAIDSRAHIWELSVGEQQRVEILRMLFRKVNILIMDEPTSVLAPQEIESLFETMRKIKNEGRSVVFITHKLEEVLEISDYITVLRRGKVMSTVRPEKVRERDGTVSTELARMMVGREVILEVGKQPMKTNRVLLKVDNVSVMGDRGELAVKGISFTVRKGEIFAILGVAGNGQRELVEAIVCLRQKQGGQILLAEKDISACLDSIAYIPEDRTGLGSVPDMPLMENVALTNRARFSKGPLVNWKAVREKALGLIQEYNIAAPSLEMKARQLSGGNLQKLILAREFTQDPLLLVAEQPTRGLDIGATEEVWQSLLRQREKGAILLVSGDMKEVLSLADNILVMFRGQAMDIISGEDEKGIERIGPLMAGLR
ncbi:MAG: ABC transporter ATP-binding protein [Deltaproteobacteria bacterium]|nr:ABC transporter ATP-binding protein [Deltaproteobacteria bacterium]MBW1977983.1 ABC transporter ATP-binding protein [Deltaproteobacteria bacterium]MBW2045245.1 ABC transporter ATP-binding protein [Deltaproteobacteria bacterium]MBW2301351.1 ABC transporter ATP-binding protein [Deltaproteobacteria bacterium]